MLFIKLSLLYNPFTWERHFVSLDLQYTLAPRCEPSLGPQSPRALRPVPAAPHQSGRSAGSPGCGRPSVQHVPTADAPRPTTTESPSGLPDLPSQGLCSGRPYVTSQRPQSAREAAWPLASAEGEPSTAPFTWQCVWEKRNLQGPGQSAVPGPPLGVSGQSPHR